MIVTCTKCKGLGYVPVANSPIIKTCINCERKLNEYATIDDVYYCTNAGCYKEGLLTGRFKEQAEYNVSCNQCGGVGYIEN